MNKFCELDNISNEILKKASDKMNLSSRGYTKVLTIADLDNSSNIKKDHILEALQYRGFEG